MAEPVELETAGTVWKLLVEEGQTVEAGETLFILEVMKMEVPYEAPKAGTVEGLAIAEGGPVEEGQVAMRIA
jgi:biotin carboxyl carrier protein